jgi:hypothetical protein
MGNGCWSAMWQCSSFPQLPWNQLGEGDRKIIARNWPPTGILPLHMKGVSVLDALGVFREFQRMAAVEREQRRQRIRDKRAFRKTYPVLGKGQWVEALFTLDFSETKKRMLQRFEAWLDLPGNQERFAKHESDPTGKTGTYKDRLKDLAIWRLYDKLGFDKMLKFAKDNRKCFKRPTVLNGVRYSARDPMPFHDARKGSGPINQAPLCSQESSAGHHKQRAKDYLAELIPWNCEEQPEGEFTKQVLKHLKKGGKISKSSS